MAPGLDDLLFDIRLARLFSEDARPCALQLWILQIRSEETIENRVIYGRLLPYSHANGRWSATDDDDFRVFGQVRAQVVRLNLYIESRQCAELLRRLTTGQTIALISEELQLGLSNGMRTRFGATALIADRLVYRPVAYLLNRDAHERRAISSPHGGAGAFSASITRTDKGELFRLGEEYGVALTKVIVQLLDAETGLDFGGADISRFGDLELTVFPALDDFERSLLSESWTDTPRALVVRFNPMQLPHFCGFQFRLKLGNGDDVVYSRIAMAERNAEGEFECRFEVGDQLRARTDSAEIEIFGFHDNLYREATLCCRWGVGYIREIHIQGHAVGGGSSPVKFDWLEKAVKPAMSMRAQAALTLDRGGGGFASRVGGRDADPWVPANRGLVSLFERLHPRKSEGEFFQRWTEGDGEGRLQFAEWFRALLAKYKEHQLVIFDPYFETAGLGLMLLRATPNADYIVFRSLPKPSKMPVAQDEAGELPAGGVNNLVAACEHNRHLLKSIKLRIYGLKEGRLHDRYILVMASDKLPVAGFHLSNSFQKAAENYPLLITPIPQDVLLKVEQYKSALVAEAAATRSECETENSSMRLLFDSTASPAAPRRYEPLRFLEKAQAGDVLSIWIGEPSLKGLSGDLLKERMAAVGLLKDDSLELPKAAGLRNCLDRWPADVSDFTETWELAGELLAHSSTGDEGFGELASEHRFLGFLARFLETSFCREHDEVDKEFAVVDGRFFKMPIELLLHSSYRPETFFHPTKYKVLTWSEYYTIKLLWSFSPDALLTIIEAQIALASTEAQILDPMRLSLLSQLVSEISLSIQFSINASQRDRLVRSGSGLLQWLGLNAVERLLEAPEGLAAVLQLIAGFSAGDQTRTLGWMVQRAAQNPKRIEIYRGLVEALHRALPATLSADELKHLVDSMRGHMFQLSWAEPWLFQDVVYPLLQNDRADTGDACAIWVRELAVLLEPEDEHRPRLFDRAREGQTTNITAFLFAHSDTERQRASLQEMKVVLVRQKRIVQQPLASTSDWTRWHGALVISMWILTFALWARYYLRGRDLINSELDDLARDARAIAMTKPISEWRSKGAGEQGELAAFFDQVEDLLSAQENV